MLNSCVCFVADKSALSFVDKMIHEDGLIDDMVVSYDFIDDSEGKGMNVYKCETDEHTWVDITKIEERIAERYPNISVEVIYASTDSESFVDVVSSDGNFDVYVDSDLDRAAEICSSYYLEFFDETEEDIIWCSGDDEEDDEYTRDY